MRQRPTAALLEESDPFSNWTTYDYRLQEALYLINKDVCKRCGNPTWLCHSSDNRIEFEVKTAACYAQGEVEAYEKDQRNPALEPGEYLYTVPVGVENEDGSRDPLPSRAEASAKL